MKQNRLARVLKNMEQAGMKQLLVSAPASVFYLTGQWIEPHERMLVLCLDINGHHRLFANELFAAKEGPDATLCLYDDTTDPVALLSESLYAPSVGIDKSWPSRFLIRLLQCKSGLAVREGSFAVDQARMYKDAEEIALLKASSALNDRVITQVFTQLYEGMRETELCNMIAEQYELGGARGEGAATLACFGAGCAEPHHEPNETRLKKGDAVLIDTGKPLQRYYSDMTRTLFFAAASDEQKKVYELVRAAHAAGVAAVAPGVPLATIDKAARDVIEAAGYGAYFTHRLGHGIGLEIHEPPDVSAKSTDVLAAPGMVFSIEPGIYLPGQFGVRVEDLVLVTEEGVELLNHADRQLRIV